MHPTTNQTIRADLERSLKARGGVPAGMTWGSFQAAMEQLGVKADDYIGSIEYGVAMSGTGYLVRSDDDAIGLVDIREMTHGK